MYTTTIAICLLIPALAALSAQSAPPLEMTQGSDNIFLSYQGLQVSLKCPRFSVDNVTLGGNLSPGTIAGDIKSTGKLEISYPVLPVSDEQSLEVKLFCAWSSKESVLRKWARFRLVGGESRLLREIVLDELTFTKPFTDYGGMPVGQEHDWQSYPAFAEGVFTGIEFPAAAVRVQNGQLVLAHKPGLKMQPGVWYESRKAVIGIVPKGQERDAFRRYIASHRPKPGGLHVNYNSWWTSPVPYSEKDILNLISTFEKNLYKSGGASFDTFCIDLGWSDRKSLWEIDKKMFPEGFTRIQNAVKGMKSNLGLWVSPSNCYSPNSFDNQWAEENGYETFIAPGWSQQEFRYACLGGNRYKEALKNCLVDMVTRFGVRHIKFDGYRPECPEQDHGHAPGELSREAAAQGIIDVFQGIRKAAPDTWMETTCMGWNPSPWWLFYVNSVIGTYGDDAPYGRIPCPVYRESYTTARDYFNLQGASRLPIPVAAQEVLGIVHQSREDFMNDGVMTVMRGHMFLPVYLNPNFMDGSRWGALGGLLSWARKNASTLGETAPLLPESWKDGKCPRFSNDDLMPRQPYGYAHFKGKSGLVCIRNPWIEPQKYKVQLDGTIGMPESAKGMSAVSLYPEPRVYATNLGFGDTFDVPLAPYETLVLSIGSHQKLDGVPGVEQASRQSVKVSVTGKDISRVEFNDDTPAYGADYTSLAGDIKNALSVNLEADVKVDASEADLLVLLEGKKPVTSPVCRIWINGKEAEVESSGSETGWAAAGVPKVEHWVFIRTSLPQGKSAIRLEMLPGEDAEKVSAWVWATKPAKDRTNNYPNALPKPEVISLGTVPLLESFAPGAIDTAPRKTERPVERINGIYLDTLEPTSSIQGWGTLQKNMSVWEKPITIGGKRFIRGLGTHAPSKITYALDGKYTRFQAWAGADEATNPTVTFKVKVDGTKRWESGLMKRGDAAKRVDIDITGAKTLELIVGDGGNDITADHADWADAKLLD